MTNEEIIVALKSNHETFIACIQSLTEEEYNFAKEGKWNSGQQLDHLYRSVSALTTAMSLPMFSLYLLFGKANRPSKDYEGLVAKYKEKLLEGGKASGRFIPQMTPFAERDKKITDLRKSVARLCSKLSGFSEVQLDWYIIPHPLLGKLTVREMMYFTMYHADHHQQIILRDLAK